ncbi:bile acid:sodium symporter family protein [Capnocytophaga sp. oral taxon 324]|uniref:bile acid:sodium symporter family protein n=1 Tax=Capnocytophaga sp. oral taxon 324 TaxID=712211 RepID=UPI0002A1D9D7|nr:bile acid:sodium symporter family protein [Capnocytophaga sp. oral taxon 324]EKY12304.1 sodium bile acid symporter family protein [Capnocytophaga sp. oral taxon 324 str. F0483]
MTNLHKIFVKNAFLWLLVLMVLMGYLIPYREGYNAYFNLGTFIDWGIVIIFLLYGLKLNLREVLNDVKNWKLHLLVQIATFVLFPLLVMPFYKIAQGNEFYVLWLSIYFLACLPSTVSSSVVMVSIAKGNVPSAIFNASISGLIGIFATPMLMHPFMESNSGGAVDQVAIIQQLLLKVLLPIVLGLLLNPLCKKFIERYGKLIGKFDRLIILLIVYESFSTAFVNRIFGSVPPITFAIIAVAVVGMFFIVYYLLQWASHRLHFNREDTITTTFCGSKKSLVHGSLFMMVLGIPDDNKVMFLLPIMLYHSFQLFYVSWLANKLSGNR